MSCAHLSELEIHNLATIQHLHLQLEQGLCVFTGETGAGKSIIIDALSLLLGTRAQHELIRTGETELLVTGLWGESSASRKLSTTGRGHARLDGEIVTLSELQQSVSKRLTIHWQHAATHLLSPAYQRHLIDQDLSELDHYTETYQKWQESSQRLERLKKEERERIRQLDFLQFQYNEITEAALIPGEEEPLQERLLQLSHIKTIADSAAGALERISEGEISAIDLLSKSIRSLNAGAKYSTTAQTLQDELKEVMSQIRHISTELHYLADATTSPEEMSQIENRLALIGKLKGKYGATLAEVLAFADQLVEELQKLETDEQAAHTLESELQILEEQLYTQGKALDHARKEKARSLLQELLSVIHQLGMPHARMELQLTATNKPMLYGLSDVHLLFSANPGEDLGKLGDLASGGELSRIMLAIATVKGIRTPCVIFDEVDAGIGGQVAITVATQLKRIAKERQVLVVTHSAQIAAWADCHFKVEKILRDGRTMSCVRRLDEDERLIEIARMLSGKTTKAALQHARELIQSSR